MPVRFRSHFGGGSAMLTLPQNRHASPIGSLRLGYGGEEARFWHRHWSGDSTASPPRTRDLVSRCTLRFKWIWVKVQGGGRGELEMEAKENRTKRDGSRCRERKKSLASDYCETGGTNWMWNFSASIRYSWFLRFQCLKGGCLPSFRCCQSRSSHCSRMLPSLRRTLKERSSEQDICNKYLKNV